jgi:hypothetical protein
MKKIAVKVIEQDDDTATVGGYGVYFGGLDMQQEGFEKDETDFMLDLVPTKMVTYDHTLTDKTTKVAVKDFIGETVKETIDDVGIWVEAQLDKSQKYVKYVLQMIDKGLIGWSSGTAAHLVMKEGTTLKRWPIVEYALTPTPAEPRALGVERLKTLAEKYPGLKVVLPEGSGDDPSAATMAGANLQLQARAILLVNDLEKLT